MLAFWCSFIGTLVLLVAALWTGWQARRRAHLAFAPLAIVSLAVTIVLTEGLMRAVDFPQREMRIHLVFAKTAALLVLPVVISGLVLLRRGRARRCHFVCVLLFLVVTVIATGTGIWVVTLSTPR